MVTELGKFLRKIRIDNNELLLDMAQTLNVSSAFLSKVENGKSKPPETWCSIIKEHYNLPPAQARELDDCFYYARNSQSIDVEGFRQENKQVMLSFARRLSNCDDEQLEIYKEFLKQQKERDAFE